MATAAGITAEEKVAVGDWDTCVATRGARATLEPQMGRSGASAVLLLKLESMLVMNIMEAAVFPRFLPGKIWRTCLVFLLQCVFSGEIWDSFVPQLSIPFTHSSVFKVVTKWPVRRCKFAPSVVDSRKTGDKITLLSKSQERRRQGPKAFYKPVCRGVGGQRTCC